MFSMPKQYCVDCHFFVKEYRGAGGTTTGAITEEERKAARANDYSWHKAHYAISCNCGVWDEGHNFDPSKKHEIITKTNRNGFCFFWKYHHGMFLQPGKILQERESQAEKASYDRKLTIIGLWLAALALAANVWLKLAEKFSWWPF